MARMGGYDQIRRAFQDVIAPELAALQGDVRRLDQKIDAVESKLPAKIDGVDARLTIRMESLKGEMLSEMRRLDNRLDGVEREVRTAIDIRERLAVLEARRVP